MPLRFVIADDHALSASGLAATLEAHADVDVVGIASNGIEAIALIKAKAPDCAVLDLSMPGANGLEAFLEARRWAPDVRVAILTGNHLPAVFKELVDAGVHGIFAKAESPEALLEGLVAVAQGEERMSEAIAKAIEETELRAELTAREIEILHGVARGLSNNQIAERLALSAKTVDSHRTSLMRKLGVHSTASLLVRAMRLGLIDV